jgi:hypothetical protein
MHKHLMPTMPTTPGLSPRLRLVGQKVDYWLLSRVLSGTDPAVKCGDPVLDQELPLPEMEEQHLLQFDPSRWY